MLRRVLLFVVLVAVIVVLAACGGPTKAGIEARNQAKDRINIVNAQISFDQAKQAFESGQFDKALREINTSIARYPVNHEYHLLQGRIYMETKRLEESIASFTTALEKKADFADAHYFSGIVYQRWSKDQKSFEHYSKAFEIDPTNVQYLLASAESQIALGELDQAQAMVQDKIAYFEHNAALRQLLGQIALLRGDPAEAARLYGEARMLNPDDLALIEDLMWAQYAAAQYGQCLESIRLLQGRSVTTASSGHSDANRDTPSVRTDLTHLQARCLTALGRSREARDLYLELTRIRPSDTAVWSELGLIAWDLGDYRRVATCSVQLMALAPDRHEGYMLKGINERQKNNLERAIGLFREACQRSPDVALPYMLLGQTLEQAGDREGALHAMREAVDVDPASTDARELLRRCEQGERLTVAPIE